VERRLEELARARVVARIWAKDPSVWNGDPATPEIQDRLGWLTVVDTMTAHARTLAAFADEVRATFSRVVLCGMGGSSLAPEVLRRTFGAAVGYPSLSVLDSTDPRAVAAAVRDRDVAQTLFLISSKSGTTLEPDCLFRHFWSLTGARGSQFVAITDPDTPLAALASERGFRRRFLNPPDIGGRYSALSYFGLVPAALLGVDVARLLERARRMAQTAAAGVPAPDNPGARLGAVLGAAALEGRDKVTLQLSAGVASLGLWIEQLIAESTGKEGKGIVPIVDEPLGAPTVYGRDRVFVAVGLADDAEPATESRLAALADAGHPVVRIALADRYDLGGAFFQWEFATAVACAVLGINAFDQPNVAESKANTNAVLKRRAAPSRAASRGELDGFFAAIKPGDYLALMAYLPPSPEYDRRLAAIRLRLRDRLKVATTVGYGPRFLHSTGQLHKGGPPAGHFVQITERAPQDIAIPDKPFTFGELEAAQAEGDLLALRKLGRPALRLEGLDLLER
jgi:glucose-6-phosphate isomerase